MHGHAAQVVIFFVMCRLSVFLAMRNLEEDTAAAAAADCLLEALARASREARPGSAHADVSLKSIVGIPSALSSYMYVAT